MITGIPIWTCLGLRGMEHLLPPRRGGEPRGQAVIAQSGQRMAALAAATHEHHGVAGVSGLGDICVMELELGNRKRAGTKRQLPASRPRLARKEAYVSDLLRPGSERESR